MAKRPLESLPHFVEEAAAEMSRQPPYITETAYHCLHIMALKFS